MRVAPFLCIACFADHRRGVDCLAKAVRWLVCEFPNYLEHVQWHVPQLSAVILIFRHNITSVCDENIFHAFFHARIHNSICVDDCLAATLCLNGVTMRTTTTTTTNHITWHQMPSTTQWLQSNQNHDLPCMNGGSDARIALNANAPLRWTA